jgi:hypothetical protein
LTQVEVDEEITVSGAVEVEDLPMLFVIILIE